MYWLPNRGVLTQTQVHSMCTTVVSLQKQRRMNQGDKAEYIREIENFKSLIGRTLA